MSPATSSKARWWAMVWSLAYLLVGLFGSALVLKLTLDVFSPLVPGVTGNPVLTGILQTVTGIVVFGLLTWLVGRRLLRLSWDELGFAARRVGLRGFAKGFGVGLAIGTVALLLSVPLGGSRWGLDGGSFGAYLVRLAALVLVLLPPAFMEELAFRGTPLIGMSTAVGRAGALLVTSVLFGLVHRFNPGVTVLALGNIALAGAFLGLTFFARGGLWTATGAHLGWNLALAGLAAPVSGLPFDVPWLDFNPGRPAWLTGGTFGPEGGLVATVMLVAGVAWVIRWRDFREEAER